MCKRFMAVFTLLAVCLIGTAAAFALPEPFPADEGELLKLIKNDVFDQRWETVLGLCDQLISQYPRSPALPRAYYYRAQALEHTRGRESEAIGAYGDFLAKFPSETGALKQDAVLSRLSLITSLYLKGNKSFLPILMQAMDATDSSRIFAAIQASKLDDLRARTKALPILKQCASSEPDPEMKNECLVALLRIDPKQVPPGVPAPPRPPAARTVGGGPPPPPGRPGAPAADEPRLIQVEVFDKTKKAVSVRVHLPLAFAELLLESLDEGLKGDLLQEFHKKPGFVDLDKFWAAIKQGGKQTLVEIDNEEMHLKVWIE